jgi:hypothetical protein
MTKSARDVKKAEMKRIRATVDKEYFENVSLQTSLKHETAEGWSELLEAQGFVGATLVMDQFSEAKPERGKTPSAKAMDKMVKKVHVACVDSGLSQYETVKDQPDQDVALRALLSNFWIVYPQVEEEVLKRKELVTRPGAGVRSASVRAAALSGTQEEAALLSIRRVGVGAGAGGETGPSPGETVQG